MHRIDCFFLWGRKKLSKSHTGIVLAFFVPYFLQASSQIILAAHHSLSFFRFFSKFSINTVFSLRLEDFSSVPKISRILSFPGQRSPGKCLCKRFQALFSQKTHQDSALYYWANQETRTKKFLASHNTHTERAYQTWAWLGFCTKPMQVFTDFPLLPGLLAQVKFKLFF